MGLALYSIFFFKQKTAYEMRISDWSSDVCSSDLATVEELMGPVQGPDFPTGGIIVESARGIREAYTTGRGSMRVRARWHVEDQGRGTYVIVVTEIPYQVQKSKLVEQIAGLINDRKLPILEIGRAHV